MSGKKLTIPKYSKYIIMCKALDCDNVLYLDIHGEFQPVGQFAYEFERWEDAVVVHNVLLRFGLDTCIRGCGRRLS